ncbi:DNA fragmentation factor subunit alpha [Latimeria chalumnae]|uniref:DNA fragmentation factor subunit alpha n=1 Tax=Latimeria chalumnae TaxID=7897 RepID=H3AY23_LATCH|nr:PREDICTED: DNA fragmentation factor subunit alpha [Latimeria chalumnae]
MSSVKKPCLVCTVSRQDTHGVAAGSIAELKTKACKKLASNNLKEPLIVVLAEDGTIVEDEDYFLCLPDNTKFMVLTGEEKWTPNYTVDGGTAWLGGNSEVETDSINPTNWKALAMRLKQNLSEIIMMSEADLQALIDVQCEDLANEMGEKPAKIQTLQKTLQGVLDRREEERQSRGILQLYLKAVEQEKSLSRESDSTAAPSKDVDVLDSAAGSSEHCPFSDRIVSVLLKKTSPEIGLSNRDLQKVIEEDTQAIAFALSVPLQEAKALQQNCAEELKRRLQQVKALHSLRSRSNGSSAAKRKK